tara:strand:- start:260 stop:1456 length:1197 start_codon:yes stop_codon:yes gene_type:complete
MFGRGGGSFSSINFSYSGKNLNFSLEPFYFYSQNKDFQELDREGIFDRLNDVRYFNETPFVRFGLRESNIYLSFNEIGIGLSNSNMWLGPGIHTSLTMTNNTTGFPHLMIGTIREKRYDNIGFNFRYIFSQLDKSNGQPYYSILVSAITFYTDPIITIGFNRNILLSSDNNKIIDRFDASTVIFRSISNIDHAYQTLATYLTIVFPNSGLKVFFELGTTERWEDFIDFINYPDHGIGSIFGFRQYGLLNNNNLVMGFEYARLLLSSFWDKRPTSNWYGNPLFDYSSYDGYRWAAHSGSDSDDLYFYFGYQNKKFSFISAFNFERHGIVYTRPPEVKMEFKIDFSYNWNKYNLNVIFEREWLEHAGFVPNKWRNSNVIWFRIERDITNMLSNKIGFIKN